MIELYAITSDPPPAPAGDLRVIQAGNLAALCAPAVERETTPDELWRHEELIESLMETCDLLPVRFGSRLESEAAVAEVLDERREALTEALERVRGAVELSVRIVDADANADAPADAGDRMRTTAARERAVAAMHAELASIARMSSRNASRDLLRAAYLVDRAAVDLFADRVAAIQRANPRLRILCTGPWPPYSFTGA